MNKRLSLVVPTYTLNDKLEEQALFCIETFMEQVDEIIVTEDGGNYSEEIRNLCDKYLYNKENKGFTANVNEGWRLATGDFVAIVNSDIRWQDGNIRDLCIPGKVTSPLIINQYIPRLAGPFWVAPKEVTEERGMLREEMRTYSSDSEYDERVKDIFQKVDSVKVWHEQAQTVKAAGVEGGEEQEKDRKIYQKLIEGGGVDYYGK